jgi:hypothetical protein
MRTPAELDALGSEKWQNGLCHIFAEALQGFAGAGAIGAVWVNDSFKHIYVSHAGSAFDSLARTEKEEALWERWRLKYGEDAVLSKTVVPLIRDLVHYGVKFGTDGASTLYFGTETSRWLTEADAEIRRTPFFESLKNA